MAETPALRLSDDLFFDTNEDQYVLTTRDYTRSTGRDIAIARSKGADFGGWESLVYLLEQGDAAHQLYSQITFRFANIYLGVVMIFDAKDGAVGPNAGHVHCRLSWSRSSVGWDAPGRLQPLVTL